jgi:hypothetical protein
VGTLEAAKLEGMMVASRLYLQAVADYIRETVPEDHRRPILLKVGAAMAELLDVSWTLYERYPELNPDPPGPHGGAGGSRDPEAQR